MSTWDPSQTDFNFGPVTLSGFAEGTMIEVTKEGDGNKISRGVRGETTKVITPNKVATIEASLQETSPSNALLMALFNSGAHVGLPAMLQSRSTRAFGVEPSAMLERIPGVTYDGNVPVRKWRILCEQYNEQII